MKTIKKAVNERLGNIDVDTIVNQTSTLIATDNNQAEVFINWNENLTVNNKWYTFTNGKLPVEFIENTKRVIGIEYFNKAENNLLGYYIENDGMSKRIDDKQMKKLDDTTKVFHLTIDTLVSNVKPSGKMKASKKVISEIYRKFNKDVWDKKLNQWKNVAKSLDDTGEVEKKEKAKRNFVEMVAWNVLGKPDNHDELGYSGSLLRKCINDKEDMVDVDKFEALAEKFVADIQKLS
tara:strand:- start:351 stop:1055 length:705 start_codon:yes stop_codon:yes gene_type:complete